MGQPNIPRYEKVSVQQVRDAYYAVLNEYKSTLWGWPGDELSHHPWQYFIHSAWVTAWNQENRQPPDAVNFLRSWLESDDNIAAVIKQYDDWYHQK